MYMARAALLKLPSRATAWTRARSRRDTDDRAIEIIERCVPSNTFAPIVRPLHPFAAEYARHAPRTRHSSRTPALRRSHVMPRLRDNRRFGVSPGDVRPPQLKNTPGVQHERLVLSPR